MQAERSWFRRGNLTVEPFVFISYGMTKCGSTLAFQLARVALIQAGFNQPLLPQPARSPSRKINFVSEITEDIADQLTAFARDLGHPIAIKTHNRPEAPVLGMIERGEARAHAVHRDLRDMALSMMDHGERARETGRPAFAEIATMEDAIAGISNQLDTLSAWLQIPGVRRLNYDAVAFDTERAAAAILDHLGIDGKPRRIARQVLNKEFTQRNKAAPMRYSEEMSAADSARFLATFAPFYRHVQDDRDTGTPLPAGTVLYDTARATGTD